MCTWTGWGVNGPNRTLIAGGLPLSRLAEDLGELIMDRNVLDKTGVTGVFNIRLEYAPDETTPAKIPSRDPVDLSSDIPRAATIFTATSRNG